LVSAGGGGWAFADAGGRRLIPTGAFGFPSIRAKALLASEGKSGPQKRLHVNSCLAKDRPECAFGEISGVMRDGDLSSCLRMAPDFMAAGALTVELKAKSAKAAHNFAVRKSR
jgi:hypothetical protein